MNTKYEAVIGLEVHAQLLTDSKFFADVQLSLEMIPTAILALFA
jgi:Asp-tRNA(Asn)/Glu-tRNA(Gln) amidotransferase B subunit